MSTFTREIPTSQLAIARRELEQAGATSIDCTPVDDGRVRVTATLPDGGRAAKPALIVNRGPR